MTREEQVDWLCRLRADLNNGVIFTPWNGEFTEALDGILEQEPSISEDGTLTVNVEDGNKVSRVLVCGDNHFGGLYYPEQEPCEDEYIKVPKKALKYRTAGMVAYNAEWLKNHFDIERAVICGEQEPCDDAISRKAVLEIIRKCHCEEWIKADIGAPIEALPPVKPQYTDAEIQKMQDLEFAEIQKAYELGKADGSIGADVLDKIRAEIEQMVSRYTISRERGGMGQVEWEDRLIKEADILQILDKYKASPTGEEVKE